MITMLVSISVWRFRILSLFLFFFNLLFFSCLTWMYFFIIRLFCAAAKTHCATCSYQRKNSYCKTSTYNQSAIVLHLYHDCLWTILWRRATIDIKLAFGVYACNQLLWDVTESKVGCFVADTGTWEEDFDSLNNGVNILKFWMVSHKICEFRTSNHSRIPIDLISYH